MRRSRLGPAARGLLRRCPLRRSPHHSSNPSPSPSSSRSPSPSPSPSPSRPTLTLTPSLTLTRRPPHHGRHTLQHAHLRRPHGSRWCHVARDLRAALRRRGGHRAEPRRLRQSRVLLPLTPAHCTRVGGRGVQQRMPRGYGAAVRRRLHRRARRRSRPRRRWLDRGGAQRTISTTAPSPHHLPTISPPSPHHLPTISSPSPHHLRSISPPSPHHLPTLSAPSHYTKTPPTYTPGAQQHYIIQ